MWLKNQYLYNDFEQQIILLMEMFMHSVWPNGWLIKWAEYFVLIFWISDEINWCRLNVNTDWGKGLYGYYVALRCQVGLDLWILPYKFCFGGGCRWQNCLFLNLSNFWMPPSKRKSISLCFIINFQNQDVLLSYFDLQIYSNIHTDGQYISNISYIRN